MGIGSSVCLASGVPAILWRKKYNKREGGSLFSLNLFTSESWQLQHHWEYNLSFHNFLFIRFVFHASRYLLVNGLFLFIFAGVPVPLAPSSSSCNKCSHSSSSSDDNEPIYQGIIERDIGTIRKEQEIVSLKQEMAKLKNELLHTQKTLFIIEDSEKELKVLTLLHSFGPLTLS